MSINGETGIRWAEWLDLPPVPILQAISLGDKIAGMMLGLAIGDALGNTSESMLPEARRRNHGWIEDYLPNRHANNESVGLPSDDTQLAFWTLERLIEDRKVEPGELGIAFSQHRIFGMGASVREFLRNFKSGKHWSQAGAPSAGNGALMRIAPVLIPYVKHPARELWGDVVLAAHLTHRDGMSTAACLGLEALLWEILGMREAPEGGWWITRFNELVTSVEPESPYASRGAPIAFSGKLTDLVDRYVFPAFNEQSDIAVACNNWYSGAYCLETIPSVLLILARFGHDPERAILEAVNNTKDNDTIAAIVGAAVGALHGLRAFRPQWLATLTGRTLVSDNHRIFAILAQAGEKFGFGVHDLVAERAALFRVTHPTAGQELPESGTPTNVQFKKVFVKLVEMLQQNWAGILEKSDGTATIYFFDDHAGIFDLIQTSGRLEAERALARNGFEPFGNRHTEFLTKPGPHYRWGRHPNGQIYSSGRYWIGQSSNYLHR